MAPLIADIRICKKVFRGCQIRLPRKKSLFSAADKISFGQNALQRLFPVFNFLLRFSNSLCKIKTRHGNMATS